MLALSETLKVATGSLRAVLENSVCKSKIYPTFTLMSQPGITELWNILS